MNIIIIGYKKHSLRLKMFLNKMGYENVINYNYHVDSMDNFIDADVFFIASPNETHIDWIRKLMKYNKHIFCEKPPVTTIDDLKAISEYDGKLYFNFNYRFTRLAKLVRHYLINGELGKLLHISCITSNGIAFKEAFKDDWRFKGEDLLSSIVGNVGIHHVDLVGYLCGEIKRLKMNNFSVVSDGLPDTSNMNIITDNGISNIFLSYAAPFRNETTVIFDNGYIELSDGELCVGSPRDIFDDDGKFITPPPIVVDKFGSYREYFDESFIDSIEFFLAHVKGNVPISITHHNQSINTTKILLDAIGG